ncbi:MAG: DUF167 domain-containing protein [Thermoleophilaceae bacterium]|nr:DUF167 domain-containing protein [Thermoleophilaceae bacterium]
MDWIAQRGSDVVVQIRVTPRASQSAIVELRPPHLIVRLNAPPADGAANKELIKLIAKASNNPKSKVTLIRGHKAREKTVAIADAELGIVSAALLGAYK